MGLGKYAARMAIQGGIGLATNLGSSLFNSFLSGRAADEQYNRQLEFWRMQNGYNTPLNQRMRLAQAGFNPASAVGEVASSQAAGELSSVPANEVMKNGFIDISSLVDSLKAVTELESIAAGTDLTSSKIATEALIQVAKMFGIKGSKLDNIRKQLENSKYIDITDAQIKSLLSGASVDDATAASIIGKLPHEIEALKATTAANISAASLDDARTLTENALRDARVYHENASGDAAKASAARDYAYVSLKSYFEKEMQSRIDLNDSQAALNGRQREKVYEEILLIQETAEFKKLIASATADEAEARAAAAKFDAKVKDIMAKNVSDETNILEYITTLADAAIYAIFTK